MAYYLFQASYTPEALAALIKKPENRIEIVSKTIEKLGGKVIGGWFCFGEYDVALVSELPDNVSAAAFLKKPLDFDRLLQLVRQYCR